MKWHDAVFTEILRVNGPTYSLLPRISSEVITIGGLQIPKGTTVTVLPLLNSYKEEYFANTK